MKLHRYVDHQRLHIVTKDVISLSISVLLLFRHYISHKITFGAPSSGGVFCSACGAFIGVDSRETCINHYLIETPIKAFANRAEPRSGRSYKSCLIRVYSVFLWKFDPILLLVDLARDFPTFRK